MKRYLITLITLTLACVSSLNASLKPSVELDCDLDRDVKCVQSSDFQNDCESLEKNKKPMRDPESGEDISGSPILHASIFQTQSEKKTLSDRLQLATTDLNAKTVANNKKFAAFAENDEEEDDFSDFGDISEAIERLNIRKAKSEDSQTLFFRELDNIHAPSGPSIYLSSHEQKDFAPNQIQPLRDLSPSNHLTNMIEVANNPEVSADVRIVNGRQALMCLISKNIFLKTFKGNIDESIRTLVIILSELGDPYGTLRLAEYLHKNPTFSVDSIEKTKTMTQQADTIFKHSLVIAYESYDPEIEYVYFFNTLRTIVSEASFQAKTLSNLFYTTLTTFPNEVPSDSEKIGFLKEIEKSKIFVEKQFEVFSAQ